MDLLTSRHATNIPGPATAPHEHRNGHQPSVEELAGLFGFTPDELALNRAGRLSPRQRQAFTYRSVGHLVRGMALITLNLVLAAYLAPQIDTRWEQAVFLLFGMLVFILAALLLEAARRVIYPRVRPITGQLVRAGTPRRPSIRAGHVELRIAYRRWKRLPPSYPGLFRVYYGPAGTLLSLEPWEDAP